MDTITDSEAWIQYPQHRKWFNKLYIADLEGYACGPSGLPPLRSDEYIINTGQCLDCIYTTIFMSFGPLAPNHMP